MKTQNVKNKPQNMYKNFNKGFTLIELLVVISIIGLLSSIVLANLGGVRLRGRDAQRKLDMKQVQTALEFYKSEQNTYPPAPLPACGLALTAGTTTYIKKIPCDPLNSGKNIYTYTSTGTTYAIIACLENVNDSQKDTANNATYCNGGTANWSFTVTNP